MGAQNHEKIDGVYLRRELSKLSREVLRTISTIAIPMYKLPQTPHSSVISIDSAGGHDTHQSRLQARPKDWGEVLGEVFKRKGAPITGSSNLPPFPRFTLKTRLNLPTCIRRRYRSFSLGGFQPITLAIVALTISLVSGTL